MAFGRSRRRQENTEEEKQELSGFDDFNYHDTLDSITAGLPGTEAKDEENREADEADASDDADVYDDAQEALDHPTETETEEENISDTPEAAMLKLQREREARRDAQLEENDRKKGKDSRKKKRHAQKEKRSVLQEDVEKAQARKEAVGTLSPRARVIVSIIISVPIIFVITCMAFTQFLDNEILKAPGSLVAAILTPVQTVVSVTADTFGEILSGFKLRANIETEYQKVVAENEELTYRAMLADELQIQLSQFETIYDEVSVNTSMNPLVCTIIGKSDGNYFSTFSINRGSRDGIEQYMAVTSDGALIGYTETVYETSSTVRTIIDSETSIAGLIQSSRDQGTIRGTLGVDGTALCRMYYLPDDSLPRPGDLVVTSGVGMSFPKGIPIGKVRESTRGMESNKSYVVIEPQADFQHIEYVVVLRYKPAVQSIQASSNASSYIELVPVDTARPYPTLRIGSASFYSSTDTPVPDDYVSPTPEPTDTPTPVPTDTPEPTPVDTSEVIEYQVVATGPTATPEPTAVPTPTPYVTIDPHSLTLEEEE